MDEPNTTPPDYHNFIRLQNLLSNIALPNLRKLFCDSWKTQTQQEWDNSVENGQKFIHEIGGNLYRSVLGIQKKLLTTGDIQKWNIPLVIGAIKMIPYELNENRIPSFESINNLRSIISRQQTIKITDENFENLWKTAAGALITLGVPEDELCAAKNILIEKQNSRLSDFFKLKEIGNTLFLMKKYDKAIENYKAAMHLPGISQANVAILYSNLSIAFLRQGNYYASKENAKGAILLNPTWWKGHYRLGQTYQSGEKYKNALENYKRALVFEQNKMEVEKEMTFCVQMIADLNRLEHLEPMQLPETINNRLEKLINDNKIFLKLVQLPSFKNTPMGMCIEGRKYLHGDYVPQNYELAAEFFSKAARLGSADGLYNLGLLTENGRGVQRSISRSFCLFESAASQEITIEVEGLKLPNIGVYESETCLGLRYQDGMGVDKNVDKAIEYYTRAMKHGGGVSALNIGTLYERGEGVKKNVNIALNYFKFAAFREVVRAMESIVFIYLQMRKKELARRWFRYALCRGSIHFQKDKEEFVDFIGKELLEKTFEADIFESELQEEVKNGPLKHLIPDDTPDRLCNYMDGCNFKTTKSQAGETISNQKLGLSDLYRINIIKVHRNSFHDLKNNKICINLIIQTNEGKSLPKAKINYLQLKSIQFEDMDPKRDHVYDGCAIKLTLIEDAILGSSSIAQIVQDENGNVQRLFVYNYPQNKEIQRTLGFGCKITVFNPYWSLALDGLPYIRVEDTDLIFFHSDQTNRKRCRYCGNENAQTLSCPKCKRTYYCSTTCLENDSKILYHHLVCVQHL